MASFVEKRIRVVGTVGNVYDLRENVGSNNSKVIDFSVAVTPRKLVDDEWVDQTTIWTNCTAWNRQAEHISRSFKSGDRVFVEGVAEMKEGYTNKEGVEVPAREYLKVERAGHECSYADTEQARKDSADSASSKSTPKASAKSASKPKAKKVIDDWDTNPVDSFDFDDDDDDDEMPF